MTTAAKIVKPAIAWILLCYSFRQQLLMSMFSGMKNWSSVMRSQMGIVLAGQNKKNA